MGARSPNRAILVQPAVQPSQKETGGHGLRGAGQILKWAGGPAAQSVRSSSPYVKSLGVVAAASLFGEVFRHFFQKFSLLMFYLLAVQIAAVSWGRGPAIATSVLGVLAFAFLFILPVDASGIKPTEYLITLASFLAVGFVLSSLEARVREEAAAERREGQTALLHNFSQLVPSLSGRDAVVQALTTFIRAFLGHEASAYLPEGPGAAVTARFFSPRFRRLLNHETAADWVCREGRPAGWGTSLFLVPRNPENDRGDLGPPS